MASPSTSGGVSRRLMVTLKLPSAKLSRFQVAPVKRSGSGSSSVSPSQRHKNKKVATGGSSPAGGETDLLSPVLPPTNNNATPEPTPATNSVNNNNHTATITTGHAAKMGPKSSMGVINAGLRALDRSGKPCRKWVKSPLTIKGLAGYTFTLESWTGGNLDPPGPSDDGGEVKKSASSDHSTNKKPSSSKPKSRLASSTTAADIENDSIKVEKNGAAVENS